MKIAQINTVCGSGSVGRITVDIFHALEQAGMEGKIFYGRRTAPEGVDAVRFGSDLSMGAHVLTTFVKGSHGFSSDVQTEKLIGYLKEYDPDVIHLHNVHGFYLNVEKLFAFLKSCGKPTVWTLHDCWAFTGHCAYFDYVGCGKWKNGCEHCPQYKNTYPYALFKDNSRDNYQRKKAAFTGVPNLTIVTPSAWLARLVRESFLKEYPVKVIYNGIDIQKFSPQACGIRKKKLVLGVANVWDRRKGLDFFMELHRRLDPERYEIAAVGISKKQMKQLPEGMIGIEHTKSVDELARLYSEASVYVNPTLEDNFPTTNLEALACGTPVVTFATGGSVESIDETCGLAVEQKDVDGLVRAVIDLSERKQDMTEMCRKRALLYDKYERFGEYLKLYESLETNRT
ncbi:MAG: glycosyltransferase [Lachnospiraceae bacterium]